MRGLRFGASSPRYGSLSPTAQGSMVHERRSRAELLRSRGEAITKKILVFSFIILWAFWGLAQYAPPGGERVSLRFSGRLTSLGSCSQIAADAIRCRVPAGTRGSISLTATVSPAIYPVRIQAISLPSWAGFQPAMGYGAARAVCTFTPPTYASGRTFELRFRATVPTYGLQSELVVTLEITGMTVTGAPMPTFPPTTPVYTTDQRGRFTVPMEELPDTVVTGTLAICGKETLRGVRISVRLIPREGHTTIRTLTDIGAVEVSVPGYGTIKVPKEKLRFASSMDITGRIQHTIDVGTICLWRATTVTPIQSGPIGYPLGNTVSGITDARGRFEVPMPGKPGEKVWGRFVDCTTREPLKGKQFTLSPVYNEKGKLRGFELHSDSFAPITVAKFVRVDFSSFGKRGYELGSIPVSTKTLEELKEALQRAPDEVEEFQQTLEDRKDLERRILALGRYLEGRCFAVEVSRGILTIGGEKVEWALLVVHIGDRTFLVEAASPSGTPRIVEMSQEAKRIKIRYNWEVDLPGLIEGKPSGYHERERLSPEEFEREIERE